LESRTAVAVPVADGVAEGEPADVQLADGV
jgi:hypothetical protein